MKKLLLIADSTYAARSENGYLYFRGSFSAKTWERYLTIAEKIHFICREDKKIYTEKEANERLQKLLTNRINVSFVTNPKNSIFDYLNPSIAKQNRNLYEKAIDDADGIVIRTLGSVSASFIISTIKKNNKKYMYECVGNAWDALWNYGIKGKILAPNAFFDERKLVANADSVLYVTEKYLQRWYPSKASQVGISDVDIPFVPIEVLNVRLQKIDNTISKMILGTAGSVDVVYKGQEYVIRALAQLVQRGIDDIEYQIAGNGNHDRLKEIAVKEGVEDKVVFLGTLSHDAVLKWLDSIDLYIQPSMLEGMPRALIEAMSRALPCLGSNVGGIPELLDEDSMFAKKNVKEIADCIEKMSKNFMQEQAKRNYIWSKKFYSTEKDELRKKFYREFERKCK